MFVPNCNSNKFYVITLHIKLYFVYVRRGNSNFQGITGYTFSVPITYNNTGSKYFLKIKVKFEF